GKIIIADLDKDGVLEVEIDFNPPVDPTLGPPRKTVDIWDWDGVVYTIAQTRLEPPTYRIHALNDADSAFAQGQWKDALRLYDRVRDDAALQPWTSPDEPITLRAYATFRKILVYVANKQTRAADDSLNSLQTEN